jgi:hypothetical protein
MKSGNELRDQGIQLSLFNAEKSFPGWKDLAMAALENYILNHPGENFQTEDVREWAYSVGLDKPKNDRAWGGVIVSAKRRGIIQFVGYENVKNPRAHSTPASVWKGGHRG